MAGKGKINDYNKSLTKEQRKANASIAGKASGRARKEKAAFKDGFLTVLNMDLGLKGSNGERVLKKYELEDFRSLAAAKGKNLSVLGAIIVKTTLLAIAGNLDAARFIRDTIGERPQDNIAVTGSLDVGSPYDELSVDELRALAKMAENETELN